jgi:hypothetical protein
MRLKRTEYGCSPIVRFFPTLLPEETFAVLEEESEYDLKISKSGMTTSNAARLVLRVDLICLYQDISRKSRALSSVYIHKNDSHQ